MIKEVVVILLNMPLKIFQSPFVYWRQLSEDDHKRIKSKMMKDINLLDEVKQDKDDGLHNATTNYVTKYNKNELVSEDYIKTIVKDVKSFEGGMEAFDDLTALSVQYRGIKNKTTSAS